MNAKALAPMIVGLAIGGFALKMGVDTLQRAKAAPVETVNVYTAREDIPRGTHITENLLSRAAFPSDLAPKGALTKPEEIVGRVPRLDAPAGLPILENMLLAPGDPGGVYVPSGFRAVAVRIDESSGVDYHLLPGCHVDVVGYFKMRTERNRQDTIARTILEDVEVVAVGARISAVVNEGEERGTRPTRAVTLLVKPDDVPTLHLAEQLGKIKLSMRGEDDVDRGRRGRPMTEEELLTGKPPEEETEQKPSVLFGALAGMFQSQPEEPPAVVVATPEPQPEPPAPAPEPDPSWSVQIYRGDQHETVTFRNRDSRERVTESKSRETGPNARSSTASARVTGPAAPAAANPQPGNAPNRPAQAPAARPAASNQPATANEPLEPTEPEEPIE